MRLVEDGHTTVDAYIGFILASTQFVIIISILKTLKLIYMPI